MEEEQPEPFKPLDARDAFESGNETARFCLYKADSHGIVHPRILNAKAALEAMEDGWRDNAGDARKDADESAAARTVEEPPKPSIREESIKKAVKATKPRRSRTRKKAAK